MGRIYVTTRYIHILPFGRRKMKFRRWQQSDTAVSQLDDFILNVFVYAILLYFPSLIYLVATVELFGYG